MSLYDFCTDIRDADTGAVIIYDFECEIEATVEIEGGLPEYSFDKVLVNGVDLLKSKSTMTRLLAAYVLDEAENASWFHDKINEHEGIVYHGLGGNDPDGHYRRVA